MRLKRRLADRTLPRSEAAAPAMNETEHALALADDLVDVDRPVDAIRLLTEANQRHRDRRIESRLVELRFAAVRHATWPSTPPAWPDSTDDLFPGELVPEVDGADMTVDHVRSGIENHGSLLVRGLIDRHRVDQLVADVDMAFDAYDASVQGETRPDLEGWYEPVDREGIRDRERRRRAGAMHTVESPPAFFDVIEMLNESGFSQTARDFFGESPMILARKATLRRTPRTGSGGWHQDGAFMGETIRSLNVWLALSHCGDDAPGLDVVGRRLDHIVSTGVSEARKGGSGYADWGVSPENAERAAAGTIVRPIFEAGDALVFDHLLLHRTGSDKGMTNGRYAIETWFLAPSTYAGMTTRVKQGYSPRDQLPIVL
jgi:hypothetical protein